MSKHQIPKWELLPGAESEPLPFGQTLSYYSVESKGYELVTKGK